MKNIFYIIPMLFLIGCSTVKLTINSNEDFISKLKAGQLALESAPLMELDDDSKRILMGRIRLTQPEFQEYMFNSYNYETKDKNYSVYYNWYNKHCELRVTPAGANASRDLYSGTEIGLPPQETINPIATDLCFIARRAAQ